MLLPDLHTPHSPVCMQVLVWSDSVAPAHRHDWTQAAAAWIVTLQERAFAEGPGAALLFAEDWRLIFHLRAFTGWTCSIWAKMTIRTSLSSVEEIWELEDIIHLQKEQADFFSAALTLGSKAALYALWLNSHLILGLSVLDPACRVTGVALIFFPLFHISLVASQHHKAMP